VKYLRNGTVFHTSALPVHYPLYAGATLNSRGAKLNNMRLDVEESPQLS
jgi:hypothetical protein